MGTKLGLFYLHPFSPGSVFFTYEGTIVYNKLINFIRNQYRVRGYEEVITPNIFNLKLWKTSGHYEKYKENMFIFKDDCCGYGIKPMNCPAHFLLYNS